MEILPGFAPATLNAKRRLIMCTEGQEKMGKTNFGLTMPGPIAVFDMDRGLEDVVDKFLEEKSIQIVDYRKMMIEVATDILPSMFKLRWDKFNKDYLNALEAPLDVVRSILIDTGTELWEYARLGVLGKLTQVPPLFYPTVNAQFRKIVDLALDSEKNLTITHKMKKEYKNSGGDDKGQWTGKYERTGFGEIGNLAQVILRHGQRCEDGVWGDFFVEVVECRKNPKIKGEEYEGEMCSFPFVAYEASPGTDIEEWM